MSERKPSKLKVFFTFFRGRPLWQRAIIALGLFVVAGFAIQIANIILMRAMAASPVSPDKLSAQIESIVESATVAATPQQPLPQSADTTSAAGPNSEIAKELDELLSAGQWNADGGASMTVGQMLICESTKSKSAATAYTVDEVVQDDYGYRVILRYEHADTKERGRAMLSITQRPDGYFQVTSDAFVLSSAYVRLPD